MSPFGRWMMAMASSFVVTATARAEAVPTRFAVLPIQGELSKTKLEVLSDALAAAAGDLFKAEVLGPAETRELLPPPQQKLATTCDNLFCFAKLGKELKANVLLATRATVAKERVLLSFKVVDVDANQIIARYQEPIADDVVKYSADVRAVIGQLRLKLPSGYAPGARAPVATAPVEVAKPPPPKPIAATPPPPKPVAATPPPAPPPPATPPPATPPPPAAAPAPTGDKPGWMGLNHKTLDAGQAAGLGVPQAVGTRVTGIAEGGPADLAGIKIGDVILKAEGTPIKTAEELRVALASKPAGATVELIVWRGGQETTVKVTLKEPPAKK